MHLLANCANFWVGLLGTLASVAIAIIAIWGEGWRCKLVGPRLRITLPNVLGVLTKRNNGNRVWYYHLRIVNKRRWSPARNAQVLCRTVEVSDSRGSWIKEPWPAPIPLQWAWGSFPLREYVNVRSDDVCDLAYVEENGNALELALKFQPNNLRWSIVTNQRMRIHLVVSSDEVDSKCFLYELAWDGAWSDDFEEMSKHVTIRNVR